MAAAHRAARVLMPDMAEPEMVDFIVRPPFCALHVISIASPATLGR
jgi:hypothetical protein